MRGFAFIDMESEDEETAAIDDLDGAEWMDRVLRVNKAKPREERKSGGWNGGGGGNKRSFSERY